VATVLIDTTVLVDVERRGDALERLIGDHARAISVITVSELLHGVHRADSRDRRLRRQAFVEQLLAAIEPIPVTQEVARVHAEMWAQLETKGSMIGAHDLWIAATAVAHGMPLATRNQREFARVPGLSVLGL
jgi:predicted nucleic acid-binding protein